MLVAGLTNRILVARKGGPFFKFLMLSSKSVLIDPSFYVGCHLAKTNKNGRDDMNYQAVSGGAEFSECLKVSDDLTIYIMKSLVLALVRSFYPGLDNECGSVRETVCPF